MTFQSWVFVTTEEKYIKLPYQIAASSLISSAMLGQPGVTPKPEVLKGHFQHTQTHILRDANGIHTGAKILGITRQNVGLYGGFIIGQIIYTGGEAVVCPTSIQRIIYAVTQLTYYIHKDEFLQEFVF